VAAVAAIIAKALQGHNLVAVGEPIPAATGQTCLDWLNLILDDWAAELRASAAEAFTPFTATGVNPQTIGPSGLWVLPARPPAIEGVLVDRGGGLFRPIFTTADPAWWAWQQPLTSGIAVGAYYQASEPNGALYFTDPPAAGTAVRLMLRTTLGPVAQTDSLTLAQGYESALILTLQEAIAEPLHVVISASLERRAGQARGRIFGNNTPIPRLSTRGQGLPSRARGGRWDYRTGTFR